jgi:hypothetical protein
MGSEPTRQRWSQITRHSHDNRTETSTNDRSKHCRADAIVTITGEELEQSGIEKGVIKVTVEIGDKCLTWQTVCKAPVEGSGTTRTIQTSRVITEQQLRIIQWNCRSI